jgi:hypothetical protein
MRLLVRHGTCGCPELSALHVQPSTCLDFYIRSLLPSEPLENDFRVLGYAKIGNSCGVRRTGLDITSSWYGSLLQSRTCVAPEGLHDGTDQEEKKQRQGKVEVLTESVISTG